MSPTTVPPTENVLDAHVTRTLFTLVLPIVPAPLATVHTCVGFEG